MKLIKSVFLAGLLLALVAAGAFAMYNRGAFDNVKVDTSQLTQLTEQLPPQITSFLPKQISTNKKTTDSSDSETQTTTAASTVSFDQESAQEQVQVLTERSQEVSQEITKVLGDFVQVNENDGNEALHERALEYGQYLYCQKVIEQYEAENNTSQNN
jgi:hypothetical protein